jgi:hypothetical protein
MVSLSSGSRLHHNLANSSCGGILAWGAAVSPSIEITDSTVHKNVAGAEGGGIVLWDKTHLVMTNSAVSGNIAAQSGGGLVAWNAANVSINGSSHVVFNTAKNGFGVGLVIGDDATAALSGSTVSGNACENGAGGGLFVGGLNPNLTGAEGQLSTKLQYISGSRTERVRAYKIIVGDGLEARSEARVTILNTSITDNKSIRAPGGGLAVAFNAAVSLNGSTHLICNHAALGPGGGAVLAGHAS